MSEQSVGKGFRQYSWALVILIYFILKPLYFNNSGTLQICDLFFVFSLALYILRSPGTIYIPRIGGLIPGFFFVVVFQCLINFIWYIITNDISMLRMSSYYIFNFLMYSFSIICCNYCGIETLKKAIARGAVYSLYIELIVIILSHAQGSRLTGTFNNPNQLGLYALIILAVFAYCSEYLFRYERIIGYTASIYFVIISASKASLIGTAIFFLLITIVNKKENNAKQMMIKLLLFLLLFSAVYLFLYSESSIILSNKRLIYARYRLLNMSNERDTDLYSGRAYGRIFELGGNFLWGMGEGAFSRFTTNPGIEIHSSFVTLLVSYGVIGFIGYMSIFWKAIRADTIKKTLINLSYLSGILIYSMTHISLRNTLLWILLGVMSMDNISRTDELAEQF